MWNTPKINALLKDYQRLVALKSFKCLVIGISKYNSVLISKSKNILINVII